MKTAGILFVALCLLGVCAGRACAQEADPAADPRAVRQYAQLQQQLLTLFAQKDYPAAADACRKQMELLPLSAEPHYNLACALSRQDKKADAIAELDRAVKLGFTDAGHMREDDDLASLRDQPRFTEIVALARQKQLDAPHEKGPEIEGVKAIEGFPEGGLRYRLRLSPLANAAKPARLVVWLHPSGGSMDQVVEGMSPLFARNGYALVVFTQKNYGFWSDEDAKALQKTLPEVAKIPGVNGDKPILMGFSAGGQMALQLWARTPGAFGGLVLDSAYPLDEEKYQHGEVKLMPLPAGDAIKHVPIFVLVGTADGGSRLWRAVQKPWSDAGIPVTVHFIPDAGHAWLFGAAQIALLNEWLKQVAAGELPSTAPKPEKPPLHDESGEPPIKVRWLAPSAGAGAYHCL